MLTEALPVWKHVKRSGVSFKNQQSVTSLYVERGQVCTGVTARESRAYYFLRFPPIPTEVCQTSHHCQHQRRRRKVIAEIVEQTTTATDTCLHSMVFITVSYSSMNVCDL